MQPLIEFDIRSPVSRKDLSCRYVTTERLDSLTADEILSGLTCLVNHLGPRDWMIWRDLGFVLPTGPKAQQMLTIPEAVELGFALEDVSRSDGFLEFIRGFDNPPQFYDAFFEARIASWCVKQPTIKRLRFAPYYDVRGRGKRPDFEIQTQIGRVICECKRAHLKTQDWAIRLERIADAFDAAMKAIPLAQEVRLEIVINRPISGDLSITAAEACRQIVSLQDGSSVEHGPFSIKISRVGAPVSPNNCAINCGRILVGTTAIKITPENCYLRVSSPWMERALVRTMGAVINTALRQLPQDLPSVIFTDGPREQGRQAAAARLTQLEYAHCIAVGVFRGGQLEFSRRNFDEHVVGWVFLGKMPSVGRRFLYALTWRVGLGVPLTKWVLQNRKKRPYPRE